jgi:hypothetical protein
MRGPLCESEPVETPPHQAEFWFSAVPRGPLPASGARDAVLRGNRCKCQRRHTSVSNHLRGLTGGATETGVAMSRCHMVPRSNWMIMPSGEKIAPWFQPSAQI